MPNSKERIDRDIDISIRMEEEHIASANATLLASAGRIANFTKQLNCDHDFKDPISESYLIKSVCKKCNYSDFS
jgi:hypothetical protein